MTPRIVFGRDHTFDDARTLPRPALATTYALLLAPVILGVPSTPQAITFVARP